MDVLLAPDQMVLQIHESIGHPLELDRILGDERNFAGTSFVTPDMFGTYRYGSELLNITFDPTRPEELASYAFDDDGTPARKDVAHSRRRPRAAARRRDLAGTRRAAGCRERARRELEPPADRPDGEPQSRAGRRHVRRARRRHRARRADAKPTSSWSIDDSRNKFQFGCERGRIIENGKLAHVVKNPNYRGISAEFWRSLARVGNADTVRCSVRRSAARASPRRRSASVTRRRPASSRRRRVRRGGERLGEADGRRLPPRERCRPTHAHASAKGEPEWKLLQRIGRNGRSRARRRRAACDMVFAPRTPISSG